MRLFPYIRGLAYVPLASVPDVEGTKQQLTVEAKRRVGSNSLDGFFHAGVAEENDDQWETVRSECYDLSRPGYIGLPRAFAEKKYAHLEFKQTFACGATPRPDLIPQTIEPRNDLQRDFMDQLVAVNNQPGPVNAFIMASTGTGKTVSALRLIANDGVPTLVLVPTNRLKEQWLGSVRERNGMRYFWGGDWVDRFAGVAQQDRCDYQGRLVVVGLVHSLARRNYPVEFYEHFGRVIFDEIHMMTTPFLMAALRKFPARVQIAMTATKRKDAFQNVVNFFFGPVKVRSTLRTTTPTVYIHTYTRTQRLNEYSEGALLNSLVRIRDRNQRIARLVREKYQEGRSIVVLSDRVEQLMQIRNFIADTIPLDTVGLFVGKYKTDLLRAHVPYYDQKQQQAKRHFPRLVFRDARQAEIYVKYWALAHPKAFFSWDEIKLKQYEHQPTEDEYNWMKSNCRVLLATYGIFGTGMDVPRLDTGIEATPRGDVRQAVGRIGRDKNNLFAPEWHSFVDMIVPTAPVGRFFGEQPKPYRYFIDKARARIASYSFHNARIVNLS